MSKGKIPVFDFGDTLVPCFRLQNELMKDEFEEHHAEVPKFDVNNFRIYTPSEVKAYIEKHGLKRANPERIIEKYKDRERRFMERNNVFSFLRKCSENFGDIGIISDNTLEGKRWLERQLKAHNVSYDGLIVSEEVGVEKPDPRIFKEFLNSRGERNEIFTYFGNNLNRDPACRKTGMDFVLVSRYKVFGRKKEEFKELENLNFENIKGVLE